MKTANIATSRPLDSSPESEDKARAAIVPRMSDLLRRYPEIGEEERQELIRFLREGSMEDIVQATYVAGLEPRLIAFRKDHPEHFPAGLKAWTPLALLVLAPVLAILWHYLA